MKQINKMVNVYFGFLMALLCLCYHRKLRIQATVNMLGSVNKEDKLAGQCGHIIQNDSDKYYAIIFFLSIKETKTAVLHLYIHNYFNY